MAAVLIAVAGCGGSDKTAATSTADGGTATAGATDTTTAPSTTPSKASPSSPRTTTTKGGVNGTTTSPESKPGGAGDEVPNATQAELTGKGGRIAPRTVSVPPFIAITVRLSAGDGATYQLAGAGKTLRASPGKPARASIDGLRSGEVVTLKGPQGMVVISANAEPGP